MKIALLSIGLLMIASSVGDALADDRDHDGHRGKSFEAKLSGYNEVHFSGGAFVPPSTFTPAALRGAVSTKAKGRFHARIDGNMIHYRLSYEGLEGAVTQAHIHFGQKHTVGGIVVWLCQTEGTPAPPLVAGLTPVCQGPNDGVVVGTIIAAQVLAQTLQGIEAGSFDELVAAIRAGATYANVHTALHPPGEIRDQIEKD
jgi:CHRD domain